MGNSTIDVSLAGNKVLLADYRNALYPVQKDVMIFSKRFVVANGDYEANGNCTIDLHGITEVEGLSIIEDRNGTFYQIVPSSITYTTTAGAVKAAIVVAAHSTATAMHLFAIGKI